MSWMLANCKEMLVVHLFLLFSAELSLRAAISYFPAAVEIGDGCTQARLSLTCA